jgi:hypothetical protein
MEPTTILIAIIAISVLGLGGYFAWLDNKRRKEIKAIKEDLTAQLEEEKTRLNMILRKPGLLEIQ